MKTNYSDQQLQAFLDEALPPETMAQIEVQMRSDTQLMARLLSILGQREAGVHGLGEIWRRHRLSCPSRQQLGGYLLDALDEGLQKYIQFHLEKVTCRLCQANLEDLKAEAEHLQATATQSRRRKYFQSSAGYLSGKKNN
jgi:hypothetical protein